MLTHRPFVLGFFIFLIAQALSFFEGNKGQPEGTNSMKKWQAALVVQVWPCGSLAFLPEPFKTLTYRVSWHILAQSSNFSHSEKEGCREATEALPSGIQVTEAADQVQDLPSGRLRCTKNKYKHSRPASQMLTAYMHIHALMH